MIEMGQKVRFDPVRGHKGFVPKKEKNAKPKMVTGTVIYINKPHKWFTAEYTAGRTKLRTAFKFCDIGKDVTVCGGTADVYAENH